MKNKLFPIIFLFSLNVFAGNMEFAQFLFNEGDYFRCVTELKRELYENSSVDTLKTVNLIVSSYIMMGENLKAIEEADKFYKKSSDIEYNYALALFLDKNFSKIDSLNLSESRDAVVFKELSAVFQNKYKVSDTVNLKGELKEIYQGYAKIKRKNPYLAMLISAVVPGLGRVYADRAGDGAFSSLTVLTPALIAVYYRTISKNDIAFYVSVGAFGAFYLGELYGAFNSASIYHKNKTEEYYKKIIIDYSASLFSPKFVF